MSAYTLSPTPPEPGTLNDRILCAIVRAGDAATRVAISQEVECNDSVLQIALGALQGNGHLLKSEAGLYTLPASLMPHYEFLKNEPSPARPTAARLLSPVAQQSARGEDVKKRVCTGPCGQEKPLSEFYTGNAKCKRCFLDRQKAAKLAHEQGTTLPRAKRKAATAPSTAHAAALPTLVVPASGAIACELQGHCVTLRQGDAVVSIDFRQLAEVNKWINSIHKAKAAA